MIKLRSKNIVAHALEYPEEWAFEKAMESHGASGMVHAVRLLLSEVPPRGGAEKWIKDLHKKYEDDPVRRYAIAAAMLHTAIDCKLYEIGWETINCEELIK